MKAYVESKGGTLTLQQGGRKLTDAELDAVAGGLTPEEELAIGVTLGVVTAGGVAAARIGTAIAVGATFGAAAAAA